MMFEGWLYCRSEKYRRVLRQYFEDILSYVYGVPKLAGNISRTGWTKYNEKYTQFSEFQSTVSGYSNIEYLVSIQPISIV